jgi:hypothetical protein
VALVIKVACRADRGDGVSRGCERRAAEAEVDRRSPSGDPRQHLIVGVRRQLKGQRPDEGTAACLFRPFGCEPGKAELVVRLDLQGLCRRPRYIR